MSTASAALGARVPAGATAGILLMLAGILLFSLNDVMGKWLVSTYTVGQVLLLRSLAALLVLLPFVWRRPRLLVHPDRPGLQAARVAVSTAEVGLFYAAAALLPLADVVTYWLAAPIYVAALSPWLLGERLGWRRWTAILVGFAGVLVALGPSAATLSPAAAFAAAGSLCFALMMITGRTLRGVPDVSLVFWQSAGALVAGLAMAPFGWVPPSVRDTALLALLGVVALGAHALVNRSLKLAPASVVAPFQYTMLLWAVAFGYLVFGDVPGPATLVGALIIVGAGLFIAHRERVRRAA